MNYIFRTCFNRPEMLFFSLEYELVARNRYLDLSNNTMTVFCIEYGSPQITYDLVEEFPFPKMIIKKNGLSYISNKEIFGTILF